MSGQPQGNIPHLVCERQAEHLTSRAMYTSRGWRLKAAPTATGACGRLEAAPPRLPAQAGTNGRNGSPRRRGSPAPQRLDPRPFVARLPDSGDLYIALSDFQECGLVHCSEIGGHDIMASALSILDCVCFRLKTALVS